MSSQIADVTEAVKDAINDAVASSGLSQTFAAERVYIPQFDLTEIGDLKVQVAPQKYERTNNSRRSTQREIPIDIGVAKRVTQDCDPSDPDKIEECDEFMQLVEEIADLFEPGKIGDTDAAWVRTEVPDPIYDPGKLKNDRTLLSKITVTFIIH